MPFGSRNEPNMRFIRLIVQFSDISHDMHASVAVLLASGSDLEFVTVGKRPGTEVSPHDISADRPSHRAFDAARRAWERGLYKPSGGSKPISSSGQNQ